MSGECGLKSANVSLPVGVGGLAFAGIPEHLVLYGFIMVVSLIIYISMQNIKKCKKLTLIGAKPSLYKLVIGEEDDWLIKERGVGAFQYILFLRMLLQMAVIFLPISWASFAINVSQQTYPGSLFDSTTSSNIPPNSKLHWFNIIISFLTPWIVVMMVMRLSKKVGTLKPCSKTFNRTLMIESSLSTENEMKYFEQKYPEFQLIQISWSTDTKDLQGLFTELEFNENVCNVLESSIEGEQEESCCNKPRDLPFYEEQKGKLSSQILKEKIEASKKSPCILFLTFLNNYQASQVCKQEKLISRFCSIHEQLRFAPLPDEIIWSSVQSTSSKWKGWTISTICLLLLVIFCSTPAGFAAQIQHLLSKSIGDTSSMRGVSTFLPPLLLILFGVLVPLAVKISTVNFGSCSRILSHTSYMRSLYGWLACSTIIFPIILAGAGNMLEFSHSLNSGGWEVALKKWECVFSADTGSFYINLLVVVAFFKCQLELHRVSDWCQLIIAKIRNCSSKEQREAASRKFAADIANRNGNNLALAVDYVWVIVFFTVWMFFCLTCPIITPAFLLFIVCKYLVAIQNFRSFYTASNDQPELLTTAAKLIIFASLFLQLNFALFMVIRQTSQDEDSSITFIAIFLLMVNLVILIINQRLNWYTPIILVGPMTPPIHLFYHSQASCQTQADGEAEELGVGYQDDYENPFMTKEISYEDAARVKTKHAWKNMIWVAKNKGQAGGSSVVNSQ